MVTAVTELSHLAVPGMTQRSHGRIVHVSWLVAFSLSGQSLLCSGIESYVLQMSQSLDVELKPNRIHLTALCPGFTRTELHQETGTAGAAAKRPAFLWQEADGVVREGWAAVNAGKPVCVTLR